MNMGAAGHLPNTTPPPPPSKNRIISHWARSTPEEGIQVIFSAVEVLQRGSSGVRMDTHPLSAERPCQWDMTLRSAYPPTSPAPLRQRPLSPTLESDPSSQTSLLSEFAPSSPRAIAADAADASSVSSVYTPSPTLLILTLDRIHQHDMGSGTGVYMENPTGACRTRCDAYRTLYIYSPKLKRDICVHSIKRESWPQKVVFDGVDVAENSGQEYHFQIWLAGASPRQMDARTSAMLDQCQQLLWVLRKDSATANVEIIVRDMNPTSEQNEEQHRSEGVSCKARKTEVSHHTGDDKDSSARSRSYSRGGSRSVHRPGGSGNNETGSTVCEDILQVRGVVFRAHKCILESAPFFTRMLSGVFREAQEDEDGKYRIELSNDMFNVEIMEHLLDYLYTREPISNEIAPSYAHGPHHLSPTGILSSSSASNEPQVRHIISANVGLNLETIVTETRNPPGLYRHRSHHQYLLPTASLTLWHWGALYRAAMHLEDKELQAHSLHQIQAHLDPESTLEQVLTWGHQHAEVKSVMLEYLIKKRREVFGDEQRSKLRPYLWAEYEEQVETLVEITSQLARQ